MRLSAKKEERAPKYYQFRENNEEKEVILYNPDDFIDEYENDISSIYYDLNKDRTNKIYEWESKEEIVKILMIEPLKIEQRELIEEQLQDTTLYEAIKVYKTENMIYDIRNIKEEIKEIKTELLKLNEVCCAMSEAVYND